MKKNSEIISEIVNVLTSTDNAVENEKNMYMLINDYVSDLIAEALEKVDRRLKPQMLANGYVFKQMDKRRIQYRFGDVCYSRALWQKGRKCVYALDQYLGFAPYARYSPLVISSLARVGSMVTYRKGAEATSLLTPLTVSHTTIMNLTRKIGKKIARYHHQQDELAMPIKKKVPIIFIEGDAIVVKNQNKKRMSVHRFSLHEGVKKVGSRGARINVRNFTDVSRKKAYKKMFRYLRSNYDIAEAIIISSSDNGIGYEPEVFYELALGCRQHEHFIDRWHIYRKIRDRLDFCPELSSKLEQAVANYDYKEVQLLLDTIESISLAKGATDQKKELDSLRLYLKRNWKYIKPLKSRELNVPQKQIGTTETGHRPYTYRLKGQGRSWTKKGAFAVITIIDEVKNGTYEEIVNSRDMESEDVVRNPKISFRAKPAEKKGVLHNTRSGSLLPQRLHGKFLR